MENQLIALEKEYWQGMQDHNYETVRNLTRFPCLIAGKDGVRKVDEATFKKMFESGEGNDIKVVNISNVEEQSLGENSAVIAYEIDFGSSDDENKSLMKCGCTSSWVKENEEWLCALHTEVELS